MRKVILWMTSCMCFSVLGMDFSNFPITHCIDKANSKQGLSYVYVDDTLNIDKLNEIVSIQEGWEKPIKENIDYLDSYAEEIKNIVSNETITATVINRVKELEFPEEIVKECSSSISGGGPKLITVINLAPSWWRLETEAGGCWSIVYSLPPCIWEHRQFAITPARGYMNWKLFFDRWFGISR